MKEKWQSLSAESLSVKVKLMLDTHWSSLSRRRMLMMFERRVNVLGVQLDRGWLRLTRGLHREIHQVGGRKSPVSATPGTTALPPRAMARSEKLVVVELVATSTSVTLVLRHGVGH